MYMYVDVQGYIPCAHLLNRCVGRCPVYTSLIQMCMEIPRRHIFHLDVQGYTQYAHL